MALKPPVAFDKNIVIDDFLCKIVIVFCIKN